MENKSLFRLAIALVAIVVWQLFAPQVSAQDSLSVATHQVAQIDTISFDEPPLPLPFPVIPFEVIENNLINSQQNDVLWEKIARSLNDNNRDSIRIIHIGDSHVNGGTYAETAGELLKYDLGRVVHKSFGINGATYLSFAKPMNLKKITDFNPDLIIVSFGTNESYGKHYNAQTHYRQIDNFISQLRARLPRATILLTTPPGSYLRGQIKNQKRRYVHNPNTLKTAETIKRYADKHRLMVWDLYAVVGGSEGACKNWLQAGMMYKDYVHYYAKGYALQGQLLYQAIMNAYKNYADN